MARKKNAHLPIIHLIEGDQLLAVVKGVSVRLKGTRQLYVVGQGLQDVPHDVTFRIGDKAEYDSYNLSYFGPITGIGAKTVTIDTGGKKRRLSFFEFNWRNLKFDVVEAARKNSSLMQTL